MKILSIDIGSHSIKATELDISFGRVELARQKLFLIHETHQENKERIILTEGQKQALREAVSQTSSKYEKCVVNIPKSWTTNRLFHFPTKDRKTIQNSLNFELEDELPFNLIDLVSDFAILRTEGTQSAVFASIALKSDLVSFISEIQMMGLDPDIITTEAMGYSYLLRKTFPDKTEPRPFCLVNIGANQTGLHAYIGTEPIISHTAQCGGNDITKAISSHYNISFDAAEEAKVQGSFLITETHLKSGSELTDDQKQFSNVIADSLSSLIREIKQMIITFKSINQQSIQMIYLTGGTSLIPNLQLYLEETLKMPVFHYKYSQSLFGQTQSFSQEEEAEFSQSIALATMAIRPERNSIINFRTGEFSKKGGAGFSFESYKKIIAYSAALLAFIYINLIIQYNILLNKTEKQEARFEKAVKSIVGPASTSTLKTYQASTSTLKTAIEKELSKYKESFNVNVKPQLSGLDLLNKISSSMPTTFKLDTQIFQFKDGAFKIAGTLDQPLNAEKIQKALEDTKLLTDIVKQKTEDDPRKKVNKFEFNAKISDTKVAEAQSARKSQ